MNRADKEYLDGLEKFLVQMHQARQEPEFTLCPVQFERDFEREFGAGDEQQENYPRYDQDMIDVGHRAEDFC